MESTELTCLEGKIDHLLEALRALQGENQHLRQQLARHAREKSLSYHNNKQIAARIRKIINQLQEALV